MTPSLRYLSVCSGIEAVTVAWRHLDFQAVYFSEIDMFPCAVLTHHYPDIPNLGDMTNIDGKELYGKIDIIVGGTPCQDFSIAGKRRGLGGERSGLDPHITIQGAMIQVDRVAKENGIAKDEVVTLINKIAHKGIVNVLELNLALEELAK